MKNENELTAALATIEKCREIVGCPAGVDLQDHLRQLAAENVGLKNPGNWLAQSDYGYEASEVAAGNGATEDEALRAGMIAIINRIETPATDRIVAGIKADGVEEFVSNTVHKIFDESEAVSALAYLSLANSHVKQLREGADK